MTKSEKEIQHRCDIETNAMFEYSNLWGIVSYFNSFSISKL